MSDEVKRVRDDWILGLMQKGLIVQLSLRRWRASAKLTADDLGIKFINDESNNFSRRYLYLGQQLLLPPEELQEFIALETRARTLLKTMSFETPWGRFIPDSALGEWERQNQVIHDEYMEAARYFGDRYNEIVDIVRRDYKIFAKDVWARLYPNNKSGATDSFVEHFAQRAVEKIPCRSDIVRSFSYAYVCFEIPMPSFVQADIKKTNEIKRKDDLAEEDVRIEKDNKRRLANVYIEKKEQFLDTFLESTVEEIRSHIAKLCVAVLESMGKTQLKSGDITIAQTKKINKIIENVKTLNFYNDEQINDLIKDLDKEMHRVKGENNTEIITARLNRIVEVSTKELDPADFNPAVDYLEI